MNGHIESGACALFDDVAAVLLVGGNSRRMGHDKAFLEIQSQPMVRLLAGRLSSITNQVLLSANNPGAYSFLNLPVVADRFQGQGPLAGLHAAMCCTERAWILALACDLPGATTALLRTLVACAPGYDVVVPRTSDGRLHPVCAIYSRSCLPAIERNLGRSENRMLSLLQNSELRVLELLPEDGCFDDTDLVDINSPCDLQDFIRLRKS